MKKERKIYELIELITFCVDYDDDGVYYATVCGALFSFCCVLAFAAAFFVLLFVCFLMGRGKFFGNQLSDNEHFRNR